MKTSEELILALSILRKYNMPISPILEYAIKERIEENNDNNEIEVASNQPKKTSFNYSEEDSSISMEDRFKKFLFDTKPQSTARIYLNSIDRGIRDYIRNLVNPNANSIYSYTTLSEAKHCVQKLKEDEGFKAHNVMKHNNFTAALNSYILFLESIS